MSWWTVVRADLTRTPLRTSLTALSLVFAFLLFGLLQPVRVMFNDGIQSAGDSRLVIGPKHSVADMLPVSHALRIEQLDNVDEVAHMTWFGGTYQDPKNFFAQFAVTPSEFLAINPEIQLPAEQAHAFVTKRRGAIVGRITANRFGWQVGDVISLIPNIWHNTEGAAWTFELVGIFDSSNESLLSNETFYFGYPYFDEYRVIAKGTVGTFLVSVADADNLDRTAAIVDAEFANSSAETATQSSAEYALSFVRQIGDVGAMTTVILIAVLFTLIMLTGHAMTRSVDERTSEIAVLRVLGFKAQTIASLIIAEFLLVTMFAAGIGLYIAYAIAQFLEEAMPQLRQIGGPDL